MRFFLIEVPLPGSLLEWTWLLLGLTFGRAFGKQLDQDIQAGDWFRSLKPWQKGVVKRLLDFLHHYWIGLLLVVYLGSIPEAVWFGWGLVMDDLPDIKRRYLNTFKSSRSVQR